MLGKRLLGMAVRFHRSLVSHPKREFSEVINLSPSDIVVESKETADERVQDSPKNHPAKYPFKKLDFNSTLLGQAMMKVKSKKMRDKYGLILLEGRRLVQEAIDAGCPIESIFFSRADDLDMLNLPKDTVKIYKTPYSEMKLWSTLTTPPGIIGIFRKPSPVLESGSSLSLTVICDQIREPGNLGAMIRNCAGVGVRRVILTPGCTDLWDSKVLRGGAGAHFKVRIRPDVDWPEIEELVNAESSRLLLASTDSPSENAGTFERHLPVSPYWSMDYATRHNFVVIGGETEGLSTAAYEVAFRTNGSRITIPLANGVESLNSVSAASVVMFEIKKQLTTSPE